MTLYEFKDWSLALGQVAKYDDGQFKGQCVSLVNQYCYRVLGVAAQAWGHAYAWAHDSNPNRAYFDKVSSIQAGDVIVYPTSFGGGYGHIGIALGNGLMLDQNGDGGLRVGVRGLFNGYSAILRRKGAQGDNMPTRVDAGLNRIVHSEMEGWPFDEVHAGKFDAQFAASWAGADLGAMVWEKWNKNQAFRAERERNRKFYAANAGIIDELKSRPTQTQLDEALAQIEALKKAQPAPGKETPAPTLASWNDILEAVRQRIKAWLGK